MDRMENKNKYEAKKYNSKGEGNHAFQSFKIQVIIRFVVGFLFLTLLIQEKNIFYFLFTKYVSLLKNKIQSSKCKDLIGFIQETWIG